MEDNNQYKAINHGKGPALVLAGPGSGKTLVLTHHIYSLIKKGADPNKILVITFTKSAAKQMYDRFKKLSPSSANKVFFGTFHSFFYRMIKDLSDISKTIISENDRNKILSKILGSKELIELYSNKISLYKSLFNKEEFDFDGLNKDYFMSVYNSYNELLQENNSIDFDDITSLFYEKVILDDVNLKRIGSLFDYVCIDEFQDINMYQYECIKKAFREKGNIYCVGDEDQSIYGFRGAGLDIMKRFCYDFKDTYVYELKTNYRSEEKIVKAAQKVISKNVNRLKSEMQKCVNADSLDAFDVEVLDSSYLEKRKLYEDVSYYTSKGMDCAILLRTNIEVLKYEELINNGILEDKEKSIAEEMISDHLNYLLYSKTRNLDYLKPVVNKPNRFIPSSVFFLGINDLDKLAASLSGTYKADALSILKRQMDLLSKFSANSFVMYLKNIIGYEKYIVEKYEDFKDVIDSLYEKIIALAMKNHDINAFIKALSKEKENLLKDESLIKCPYKPTITTYHRSKGLEFDCVFLPDVVKGRVPPEVSEITCNIEEERRLFYVAMTRAKKKLKIYTIKDERSVNHVPSSFISEFI